ncbi:MAG: amidohydrolase family protein [Hyphomicrobiales bacterium]|nr:amidohydrolase family protein [Hyphomicrobiales bacterium]
MDKILIKNARIITMDSNLGDFKNADILIHNDKIIQVGENINVDNAEIIDATNFLITPGLINTHIHTWQTGLRGIASDWTLSDYLESIHKGLASFYKPDDMYIANYIGALYQINTGATTIVDWCHNNPTPDHTDAAIRGLEESNIRGIFLHGSPKHEPKKGQPHYSETPMPRDEVARLKNSIFSSDDNLLNLGISILGPQQSTLEVCKKDFQLAKDLDLIISMHIGGKFLTPDGFDVLKNMGLLNKKTNIVHANNISNEMLDSLVNSNVTFSITPEEELQMGFGNPLTKRLLDRNGVFGFGSDIESAMSGDMLNVIRFALQAVRHEYTLENYQINQSPPAEMKVKTRQAFEWATIDAAKMLGIDDKVGSIVPGKKADLIMFKTNKINFTPIHDPISSILFHSNSNDIDTVMVDGKVLKSGGQLLNNNLEKDLKLLSDSGYRIIEKYENQEK